MSNPPLQICAECDKPISSGDSVWHQPFAASAPTDSPNATQLSGCVSTSNNGGLPLHRSCFMKRHPDVDLSELK
jgi:hypothetical protein